jgi:hypothetical protein
MVRVRGTVGAFLRPQPGIGGVIADNYAEASRLFNADEFYDCSRWLLGQHQRLPIQSYWLLAPMTNALFATMAFVVSMLAVTVYVPELR